MREAMTDQMGRLDPGTAAVLARSFEAHNREQVLDLAQQERRQRLTPPRTGTAESRSASGTTEPTRHQTEGAAEEAPWGLPSAEPCLASDSLPSPSPNGGGRHPKTAAVNEGWSAHAGIERRLACLHEMIFGPPQTAKDEQG